MTLCFFVPLSGKLLHKVDYERLEEFRHFGGVRVEDDYVIIQDGYRLLGNPIPKTINEIEEVRGHAYA